jgi:hypothetical protein
VCKSPAADAHHIIERRLFPDGGYYIDNGASLCPEHHLLAESTEIGCDELRNLCKIAKPVIPPHLYRDQQYDKWGNPTLPNGTRLRGELFHDASVQKIIAPVLHLFTDKVKYSRTHHVPWSPCVTDDDRIIDTMNNFSGKNIVITVKMDGENTTMYSDYIHARSIDYKPHPSRSRIKQLHAAIQYDIPKGWRVCGENVTAKHSIHYKNLDALFYVFSIWNEHNVCLSWRETKEYASLLNLLTVPVLYDGEYDEKFVKNLNPTLHDGNECEGYVIRTSDQFTYAQFKTHVAKYVRKNHVQTHGHWMRSELVMNELITDKFGE